MSKPFKDKNWREKKIELKARLLMVNKKRIKCGCCDSKKNITRDHWHPRSKGGTLVGGNKSYLCEKCNLLKGNKIFKSMEEFKKWKYNL